jgi:fructose-1,6-bisphosphatase/sedoheptulose 1,7-bisphosphatase-like protein
VTQKCAFYCTLVAMVQAAALAGGRWLGKGNKNEADQAAVDQMRKVLNSVAMDGVVVIGEGAHRPVQIQPMHSTYNYTSNCIEQVG